MPFTEREVRDICDATSRCHAKFLNNLNFEAAEPALRYYRATETPSATPSV